MFTGILLRDNFFGKNAIASMQRFSQQLKNQIRPSHLSIYLINLYLVIPVDFICGDTPHPILWTPPHPPNPPSGGTKQPFKYFPFISKVRYIFPKGDLNTLSPVGRFLSWCRLSRNEIIAQQSCAD
jgi:hypothetical protein